MVSLLVVLLAVSVVQGARLWHITDTHVDAFYTEGAYAECTTYQCCDPDDQPRKGKRSRLAGKWGDVECHIPLRTLESGLDFLAEQTEGTDDIIFWTMDTIPNNLFNESKESNMEYIAAQINLFVEKLPGRRIFPAVGNHDYYPVGQWQTPPHSNWMIDQLAEWWDIWLPSDALETVQKGAYYTVMLDDNIRLIVVNHVWFDTYDWHAYLIPEDSDPADQNAWLQHTLAEAKLNGQKVWILGHEPVGQNQNAFDVVVPMCTQKYLELIGQYYDTIQAQMFGHLHCDDFRLYPSPQEVPVLMLLTSSMTMCKNINPSMRRYEYDPQSGLLLDYTVFFANVSEANRLHSERLYFEELYSAKKDLGLKALYPGAYQELMTQLKSNATLFNTWCIYHYAGNIEACRDCDATCRQHLMCNWTEVSYQDWLYCSKEDT